ncbi:MAG: beta family protein [Dyella sp.]|uniref:beta family protein n=1 Tax=Dyella sp. TaxID=1869338 RepID=UPI003F804022
MRINSHQHYFAVMKGKMGELQAAGDLAEDVLGRTTFVWELPPQPFNHETRAFGKTVDSHIEAFSKRLHDALPNERSCFVDCRFLKDAAPLENGETPLHAVLRMCADLGANPSIGDAPTDAEIQVVRTHLNQGEGEILLRLSARTFARIGFTEKLDELLNSIGARPNQCHLFFDFEQLSAEVDSTPQTFAAYSAIAGLRDIDEWLSVSVVGASTPKALPPAEQCPKLLPRLEWNIWREVVSGLGQNRRIPSFGDYGVSSYHIEELDPRLITVSANIRYTAADGMWAFKGKSLRRHSFEQFRVLSQQIVQHAAFCGPDFSWGDKYILECANGLGRTGNTTTWRRVGTNHHVAFVARQIAGQA